MNSRLLNYGLICAVLVTGLGISGLAGGSNGEEPANAKVVTAQRFDVVDKDGHLIASFGGGCGSREAGRAVLDLTRPGLESRIALTIQEDGTPYVYVRGPDGKAKADLHIDASGTVRLGVGGGSRQEPYQGGFTFGFPKHNVPTLEFLDSNKEVRLRIAIDAKHGPVMTLVGKDSERRITATGDTKP